MANLQKYKILDPRLEVSETFKKWYVMLGSPDIVCQVYPTSQYSNSNLTFNIPLPNAYKCIVDRSSAIIALPVHIVMHGTGGGSGNIFQPLREGLRSYPFDKMVITSNINMNGNLVAYQNYEQILPMERYNDNHKNNQIVPTMCDPSQNYSDTYNTNMSPFATRFSNPAEVTRRAYPMTIISNNTTDAVIDTVLYWNIFDYPPFTEKTDVVGINITPFVLNYTFINNLAHIWSRDAGHTQNLQTLAVTLGSNSSLGQPRISMNVLSLPSHINIPDSISYPYHLITFFPSTTTSAIAPATSLAQQGTQIIQLNTVPSKIYLYVKVATQSVLASTAAAVLYPDVFASITRVAITFGNKNNLLASASQWDLYNMSKKNGLSDKWGFSDWSGYNGAGDPNLVGSVVCIDPSKDLSLEDGYIVGKNDKINFQALIDYTTLSPYTVLYDVCVLCVYDGIQTMRGNQCELNNLVIGDIHEIQESPISYHEMKSIYGGAIAGDARSFFSNVWGKLKDVAGPINQLLKDTKAISNLAPMVPYIGGPLSSVASHLGYGEGEGGDFYEPEGGFIAGEGEGVLAGGKVMRRSALKKNLTRYRRY
jgi:hypothetical protein